MIRFGRLVLALIYLVTGFVLGLVLLEGILQSNSTLLQRGMAVSASVDPPLVVTSYDVYYSDADAFYWRPDLIRPISAGMDKLEARVRYETDEFGFRNPGPIPPAVDVVVLGRSISLAGHLDQPWPQLLKDRLNWQVYNLSLPGSDIDIKRNLFERFGLPRTPHWVIVEVVPSIDFMGRHAAPSTISQQMVVPVLQQLIRRWGTEQQAPSGQAIYPLAVDLPGRSLDLTCCLHYLDFYSLDQKTLEQSQDWAAYRAQLLKIVEEARANQACVALLYVPTKPDIYFPLAQHPEQLEPALKEAHPYQLGASGWILSDPEGQLSAETIRQNALAGRDSIQSFARENDLLLIDPNDALIQAVLAGQDPFMVYDSHWNQFGHQLIAEFVAESLQSATCP